MSAGGGVDHQHVVHDIREAQSSAVSTDTTLTAVSSSNARSPQACQAGPSPMADITSTEADVGTSRGNTSATGAQSHWKSLFTSRAPKQVLCKGHKEPCVQRTVNKSGPNQFRKFYVCARPAGAKDNPAARCDHFEWLDKPKIKQKTSDSGKV